MPITGLRATVSAYGRAIRQLTDELDEGVDVVVGRQVGMEVGDAARAALQLGQKVADLVAGGSRDDNRGALTHEPPGDCVTARHCNHGDRAIKLGATRHCSPSAAADASRSASTSALASTASAMATRAAAASAVKTSSPSPHEPLGAWASHSTSAMRSVVARKASSPVISYRIAPPQPTRAFAGCHTPSPMATTKSWSSTAASRSASSPPSSNDEARKATAAPMSP